MKQYYIASHHEKKTSPKPFFLRKKRIFGLFSAFSAKCKNGRFSVIPAGTISVIKMYHFFGDLDGPNNFRKRRSKIRGTYIEVSASPTPKNGQISKIFACLDFVFHFTLFEARFGILLDKLRGGVKGPFVGPKILFFIVHPWA